MLETAASYKRTGVGLVYAYLHASHVFSAETIRRNGQDPTKLVY